MTTKSIESLSVVLIGHLRRNLEILTVLAIFDPEPLQYNHIRGYAASALSILDELESQENWDYLSQLLTWIFRGANQLEKNSKNQEIQKIAQALYQDFKKLEVNLTNA